MQAIRDHFGLERLGPDDWREIAGTVRGDGVAPRLARRTDPARPRRVGRRRRHRGRVLQRPRRVPRRLRLDREVDVGAPRLPGSRRRCSSPARACRSAAAATRSVEMVDLVPTVLDLADVPAGPHPLRAQPAAAARLTRPRSSCRTRSRRPASRSPRSRCSNGRRGPTTSRPGCSTRRRCWPARPSPCAAEAWTYVWRLYEPPELYDRHADPGELVNLAGRDDLAAVEAELRDAVLRWMVETADVVPWDEDPRRPPVISMPGHRSTADLRRRTARVGAPQSAVNTRTRARYATADDPAGVEELLELAPRGRAVLVHDHLAGVLRQIRPDACVSVRFGPLRWITTLENTASEPAGTTIGSPGVGRRSSRPCRCSDRRSRA